MELDDKELVKKFKNGDRSAFDMLVSRYKRKLYSVIYRMTCNHQETDELLQETFLKLYTSIGKYDDSYPFYPWLHKVAVNITINNFKKEQKHKKDQSLDCEMESKNWAPADNKSPYNPEIACIKREQDVRILNALKEVSPTYRTALVLRVFEGLSYKEIGDALGCTAGTVMSRLNRARNQVKEILEDYLKSEIKAGN